MIRRPPRSTLSSSSAASDVYKRQVQMLEQRVQYAEEDARSSRELLDVRTQMFEESQNGSGHSAEMEKLQDENEALKTKVIHLQAMLEVSCSGQEAGVADKGTKEYADALEADLILAKTEIATLKTEYSAMMGRPQISCPSAAERSTPTSSGMSRLGSGRSRPGHRRTQSRGDMR
eukprot:TRINITY_DN19859_c0_g1_i2.p1 TRINITY_DN19859_c0_g1~~TRINITY_DN19859_c0_g1_i2.p1  ORF type:complete len:175 (+),score=43.72 TRINITY_DN19859_c0_g1_i2:133-657(+)